MKLGKDWKKWSPNLNVPERLLKLSTEKLLKLSEIIQNHLKL